MSTENTVLSSTTKVLLPPYQEWFENTQMGLVKRGWNQIFPVHTPDKPQWYARVVLTESIPINYVAYVRIDWIQDFGQNYRHWDKKKTFRCYISRDLSDDPVFTLQHRKKYLQPYPAMYSVHVKRIFRELFYFHSYVQLVNRLEVLFLIDNIYTAEDLFSLCFLEKPSNNFDVCAFMIQETFENRKNMFHD